MQISAYDQILFDSIKERMTDGNYKTRKSNYITQTELLWSGQHYLLVRTGPKVDAGKAVRKVTLWSREYLLLRRKDRHVNAMIALALAAIEPVHHEWRSNRCRLLHKTDGNGHARFRGKKFSKSVLSDMVAFCEEEERTFFEREVAESNKLDEANKFSQAAVRFVECAGFKIAGTIEKRDVARPAGERYEATPEGFAFGGFEFTPNSSVEVEVEIQNLDLDATEFEILVEALGKIQRLKRARMAPLSSTSKEEVETA